MIGLGRQAAAASLGSGVAPCHKHRMAERTTHPYSIDVRPCWRVPNRYVCSILEKGTPRRHGPQSYATFDEARRAAQERLRQLVFEWQLMGGPEAR